MNRIALLPLCALPLAFAFASLTPACGDACEDLTPICERCTDATTRTSCEKTVDDNIQDICSSREGQFESECPEVLSVASSTGVTTSASVTSASSSGVGGQGGSSSSAGGTSAGGQGGN